MPNIEEIIKGCQQHKMKSQKLLYDMYSNKMFSICLRYTKSREEAEDVFQDAFLKVFKNIHQYNFTGSFEGWLRRIFVNTAISNYRQNINTYYHAELEKADYQYSQKNTIGDVEFTKEELQKVIDSLPAGYKLVFNMYAVEGYKHKEIADMLEIDISTSKSQYSRAKKVIREKLYELSKITLKSKDGE
jgi:RNA polymerase sigma-70 factor (ECF subfamily)